ncbi:unnamed protein product [Symbiodinium sp. CCMP2592]|nr:unnamed protein product [Symbiodinium sp. CCMP2592]
MLEMAYARRKSGKLTGWWKGLVMGLILECCVGISRAGLACAAAGMRGTLSANPGDTLQHVQRRSPDLPKYLTLSAHPSNTLQEIQKKNKDIGKLLKKTPWPKLERFSANGRTYSLPLRAGSRQPSDSPAKARLACLAGFFDGNGCVSYATNLTGAMLTVCQSWDQAEVLMILRETLGGSITRRHRGVGLTKPELQWRVCGGSARRAAQLLAPHSIAKQKQLLMAVQWPETKSAREQSRDELRALKKYDSATAGRCSWDYCAGFFDAEGHIEQPGAVACLRLRIVQKHPQVLNCLRSFLSRSLGIDATLGKPRASKYEMRISGLSHCKRMLQHMLATGLVCKAKQAEIAMGLTKQNAAQVNARLACLNGNRQFGMSRDAAGRERARRINVAQKQAASLKRRRRLKDAEDKLHEVARLKSMDRLLNARRKNQQLIEYIRKLQSLLDSSWNGSLAPGM